VILRLLTFLRIKNMHPEEIKAALRMRGKTFRFLADELGVTPSSVSQTAHGAIKSPRIQTAISVVLGRPASDIWPGQVRLVRRRSLNPHSGEHHEPN
jgi:lambda repressor-like predicted transcriptional regulator